MRHLYSTRAEVLRLTGELINGTPSMTWSKVAATVDARLGAAGELQCRLDLTFQRPGKDQPMAVVAGRAPDRIGVAFYDSDCDIRAGDRLHCIDGPIEGTFEIRAIPDVAAGYARAHHMEVQVIEVTKGSAPFPGASLQE